VGEDQDGDFQALDGGFSQNRDQGSVHLGAQDMIISHVVLVYTRFSDPLTMTNLLALASKSIHLILSPRGSIKEKKKETVLNIVRKKKGIRTLKHAQSIAISQREEEV
jgi:hypothetical protein